MHCHLGFREGLSYLHEIADVIDACRVGFNSHHGGTFAIQVVGRVGQVHTAILSESTAHP